MDTDILLCGRPARTQGPTALKGVWVLTEDVGQKWGAAQNGGCPAHAILL